MKFARLFYVCAAAAILVLAAFPLSAFTPTKAKITIPFEFVASGQTMPAGAYVFELVSGGNIMSVRGPDGRSILVTVARHVGPNSGPPTPQIIFKRKGGMNHLSEVWTNSRPGGNALALK